MTRNPKWTKDELILALDLYFRVNPIHTSEKHPEIVQLSELLNSLPIHARPSKTTTFRNPDGVYMKLCNFLRFDPNYEGRGLIAGSKLDEEIWNEFAADRKRLSETTSIITKSYKNLTFPQTNTQEVEIVDEDEEFPEGKIITRLHRLRERSSTLTKRKKLLVLKQDGTLTCEACDFNFAKVYGNSGIGYIECHHNMPLSTLSKSKSVRLSELSLVCSNCHRMIHRVRPWLSVQQLRMLLANKYEKFRY